MENPGLTLKMHSKYIYSHMLESAYCKVHTEIFELSAQIIALAVTEYICTSRDFILIPATILY